MRRAKIDEAAARPRHPRPTEAPPAAGRRCTVLDQRRARTRRPAAHGAILAALREALSNVARHAHASAVHVAVHAGDELLLAVTDNGRGIDPAVTRSSGLRNLRRRAEKFGGTLEVTGRSDGGTRLRWRIPLPLKDPSAPA